MSRCEEARKDATPRSVEDGDAHKSAIIVSVV